MDQMTNALRGEGIALSFGGIKVLKGLDVEFRAGEITGLIGPNGAGKTSLFNCLTGAYSPQQGTISYAGDRLNGLPPAARANKGIVRSFQHVALCPDLTVRENVMMGIARYGKAGWLSAFLPLPPANARKWPDRPTRRLSISDCLMSGTSFQPSFHPACSAWSKLPVPLSASHPC